MAGASSTSAERIANWCGDASAAFVARGFCMLPPIRREPDLAGLLRRAGADYKIQNGTRAHCLNEDDSQIGVGRSRLEKKAVIALVPAWEGAAGGEGVAAATGDV